MMDTTGLIYRSAPTGLPPAARGYILTAPKSFSEAVSVVLPEGSTERTYGPCKFGDIHGSTLPAAGAPCVITFDEQNHATIVWWEGAQGPGVSVLNTAGKTSKQLDETFTPSPPPVGTIIVDTTNHIYLQREATKWYKSAALTEIA